MNMISPLLRLFLPCAFDATEMNRSQMGTSALYTYRTNDTAAVVGASGYFDEYVDYLRQGDQILVAADLDGAPAAAHLIVSSADGVTPVTTA